ncbi:MAG: hypothetical protein COC01_09260 [Bacteroidetes bacterium]|nr:MAG: hypothetical protein COC01_09260 [Bacteroidota bacterium]
MTITIVVMAIITLSLIILSLTFYKKRQISRTEMTTLNEEKKMYEIICKESNDAMLVIDIVNGNIITANNSSADMLGYTLDELMELSVFQLYPKEYLEESSKRIAEVWENKGMVFQDLPLLTKRGDELSVESSGKVLEVGDRPTIVLYSRDITERLKMEKEIRDQKEEIEEKNKDITDSINYAKRIQQSMLVKPDEVSKCIPDSFILFMPKDIVSGDFYFFAETDDDIVIAAVDCTGHGVPGSMMSMLGNEILNRTVIEQGITEPGKVLRKLHEGIRVTLKQDKKDVTAKDGMDIALCTINKETKDLYYSGAHNPLYIVNNNRDELVTVLKAERYGIGGEVMGDGQKRVYETHKISRQEGDGYYICSDGFQDQFGGPRDKKFSPRRMRDIMLNSTKIMMKEQKSVFKKEITDWMIHPEIEEAAATEQTDDILMIGFRL